MADMRIFSEDTHINLEAILTRGHLLNKGQLQTRNKRHICILSLYYMRRAIHILAVALNIGSKRRIWGIRLVNKYLIRYTYR